jgi:hypothetical protein
MLITASSIILRVLRKEASKKQIAHLRTRRLVRSR